MLSARLVRGATWLLAIGVAGVRLVIAPVGFAVPKARSAAGRPCAFQDSPAPQTSANGLRDAVVCLINRTRTARGLPPLRPAPRLSFAAQGHTDQMVARQSFSHESGGSDPGTRLSRVGFRWSAFGEDISTGYATPVLAVHGWLASPDHCRIMLSPSYRDIGVGVDPRPVRGFATLPGTWTADFALPAGAGAPSGNWGPANRCPY
jgi:uncharacterized protein YkwD